MSQPANMLSEEQMLRMEKTVLYEEALNALHAALDAAGCVVKEFQDAAEYTQSAFRDYDTVLRKSLAQHCSVRHKDFDEMFKNAIEARRRRESELSLSVRQFLSEQTELSQEVLRELASLPQTEQSQQARRTAEVAALTKKFAELQHNRRRELLQLFRDFKAEQEAFSAQLRACIAQAKELRLKDLKAMFEQFQRESEARTRQTQARRKEVAEMLQRFKLQRLKNSKNHYARKNAQ
ncbi:MAG: hypothetical protein D0433_06535 [Candidatus Thermochlorobacter aerophilum]|jgi:1,6-anhydro-N-acetylmuramate kinase|uniref:Uncharacterized protein n=1 Tax=Candidatus Thermochlorobacter aerophilus TaxID=1868324 RepID=A0A395M0H1_9BACT|nr:MAG: hypothetical protein D0433_06535 [Candidatus Thermochlorobacter aerophilum]